MFPPATLPRLVASSLALLSLGVGPAAAQQQAAVVTVVYDGVARPSLCDRQSFVFLSNRRQCTPCRFSQVLSHPPLEQGCVFETQPAELGVAILN